MRGIPDWFKKERLSANPRVPAISVEIRGQDFTDRFIPGNIFMDKRIEETTGRLRITDVVVDFYDPDGTLENFLLEQDESEIKIILGDLGIDLYRGIVVKSGIERKGAILSVKGYGFDGYYKKILMSEIFQHKRVESYYYLGTEIAEKLGITLDIPYVVESMQRGINIVRRVALEDFLPGDNGIIYQDLIDDPLASIYMRFYVSSYVYESGDGYVKVAYGYRNKVVMAQVSSDLKIDVLKEVELGVGSADWYFNKILGVNNDREIIIALLYPDILLGATHPYLNLLYSVCRVNESGVVDEWTILISHMYGEDSIIYDPGDDVLYMAQGDGSYIHVKSLDYRNHTVSDIISFNGGEAIRGGWGYRYGDTLYWLIGDMDYSQNRYKTYVITKDSEGWNKEEVMDFYVDLRTRAIRKGDMILFINPEKSRKMYDVVGGQIYGDPGIMPIIGVSGYCCDHPWSVEKFGYSAVVISREETQDGAQYKFTGIRLGVEDETGILEEYVFDWYETDFKNMGISGVSMWGDDLLFLILDKGKDFSSVGVISEKRIPYLYYFNDASIWDFLQYIALSINGVINFQALTDGKIVRKLIVDSVGIIDKWFLNKNKIEGVIQPQRVLIQGMEKNFTFPEGKGSGETINISLPVDENSAEVVSEIWMGYYQRPKRKFIFETPMLIEFEIGDCVLVRQLGKEFKGLVIGEKFMFPFNYTLVVEAEENI